MKSKLSSKIGIVFLNLIGKLPFWCLYILSDLFFLLAYYIVDYRKDVVLTNLKNSFPEKSEDELKSIRKKFYRHFSDLSLETIKMRGMSEKDLSKRFLVKNADLLNAYFDKGKSVTLLAMHYNNWEWAIAVKSHLKFVSLGVFKPLQSKIFNKYFIETRSKFGLELVPNDKLLKRLVRAKQNKEVTLTWLAGDQTPPEFHKSWYIFLNQESMFYKGPVSVSQSFDNAIFFQKIDKLKRGRYETSFELIAEDPKQFSESEIIKKYIEKMEEVINEKPEFYLWSHKRWKHKRPANISLQ